MMKEMMISMNRTKREIILMKRLSNTFVTLQTVAIKKFLYVLMLHFNLSFIHCLLKTGALNIVHMLVLACFANRGQKCQKLINCRL